MTFIMVMLAGAAMAAAPVPDAEEQASGSPAPAPAPAAAPAAAEAPAPVLSPARRAMQVQLDKAPEPQQRRHSRQERKRIVELYLDQLGQPVPRGGPRPGQ